MSIFFCKNGVWQIYDVCRYPNIYYRTKIKRCRIRCSAAFYARAISIEGNNVFRIFNCKLRVLRIAVVFKIQRIAV